MTLTSDTHQQTLDDFNVSLPCCLQQETMRALCCPGNRVEQHGLGATRGHFHCCLGLIVPQGRVCPVTKQQLQDLQKDNNYSSIVNLQREFRASFATWPPFSFFHKVEPQSAFGLFCYYHALSTCFRTTNHRFSLIKRWTQNP